MIENFVNYTRYISEENNYKKKNTFAFCSFGFVGFINRDWPRRSET